MTSPKRPPRTGKPVGWEYQVVKHSKRVGRDIVEKTREKCFQREINWKGAT